MLNHRGKGNWVSGMDFGKLGFAQVQYQSGIFQKVLHRLAAYSLLPLQEKLILLMVKIRR